MGLDTRHTSNRGMSPIYIHLLMNSNMRIVWNKQPQQMTEAELHKLGCVRKFELHRAVFSYARVLVQNWPYIPSR
jgi:hypothetical protein